MTLKGKESIFCFVLIELCMIDLLVCVTDMFCTHKCIWGERNGRETAHKMNEET